MSSNNGPNIDELINYSPEMIAHSIFTKNPKDPCTYQILAYQDGSDITYIFEILITILLEGLNILTYSLKDVDLSEFSSEHILILNPWFKSLGFNIRVTEFPQNEKDLYEEYYCKIVVNNKVNENLFIARGIEDKSYHFFLNGTFLNANKQKTNLKDIFGVFLADDTAYCISFDFL